MKARHCCICGEYVAPGGPHVELGRGRNDTETKVRHVNCEPGTVTFFRKATPEARKQYLDMFRRFTGEPDEAVMRRLRVSDGYCGVV